MNTYQEVVESFGARRHGGYRFYKDSQKFRDINYSEFSKKIRGLASGIKRSGIRKGDFVVVMVRDQEKAVLSVFACFAMGAVPVPAVAGESGTLLAFRDQLAHILKITEVRLVLTDLEVSDLTETFGAESKGRRFVDPDELATTDDFESTERVQPGDTAFLQFTSGSTSFPKGVVITHENLMNNIRMILDINQNILEDRILTWIPIFHDLGLVATYLVPAYVGNTTVALPTSTFMRRPLVFMKLLDKEKITHTAVPTLGIRMCLRFFRAARLEGLNLSKVKAISVGAEPIPPEIISNFLKTYEPYGLKNVILPAYGMAEGTLMMTSHRRGDPLVTVKSSEISLPSEAAQHQVGNFLSCGSAAKGLEVKIFHSSDKDSSPGEGNFLDDLKVGEVVVKGPSVTKGYYKEPQANKNLFTTDGWLRTGDMGFLRKGQLFICGRIKDLIICNGRNYYPSDIEEVVETLVTHRTGGVAAVSSGGPVESLFILAEARLAGRTRDQLEDEIRKVVIKHFGLAPAGVVLIFPPDRLPRTSSGKIRRLKAKQMFVNPSNSSPGMMSKEVVSA